MKLKKILALVCSVAMSASLFVSTSVVADAAVDGATATLEFAGYETKGTSTFAVIKVKATIPDTLVPYEMIPADWETTFADDYKGLILQGCGFDIPNVTGLTYISSLSSSASYVQIQSNTAAGKLTIYAANTGSYDTWYAGEIDELATLYYRITGNVDDTYNLELTDAVIKLYSISGDGDGNLVATPKEYTKNDFTITNATVKPASTVDTVAATSVALAEPGEGEKLDTTSEAAVAYKVEKTFASGQTAYWTATINGAAKKLNRELANLDGTSSVGLIITGDATISNVALNVVTSN